MAEHKTSYDDEGTWVRADGPDPIEKARSLHHLATADPEPERDGKLTGPAHEEKYGLERAKDSAALWRGQGVHPTENRALVGDEDGAENLRGVPSRDAAPDVSQGKSTAQDSKPRQTR